MLTKRSILAVFLLAFGLLHLWGGTGRPSDGLLSFILILGFLLILLGILQLASLIKRRIAKILEDIY